MRWLVASRLTAPRLVTSRLLVTSRPAAAAAAGVAAAFAAAATVGATKCDGAAACGDCSAVVAGLSGSSDAKKWAGVIERVSPAIVSLRVCVPMSFDTEGAGCSVATGFVVDAKQGLILTNRHVVHQGPVTAEAVFQNNEEVPCYQVNATPLPTTASLFPGLFLRDPSPGRQVYSDPIHDFGVFKFDPAEVRHMELAELEVRRSLAHFPSNVTFSPAVFVVIFGEFCGGSLFRRAPRSAPRSALSATTRPRSSRSRRGR